MKNKKLTRDQRGTPRFLLKASLQSGLLFVICTIVAVSTYQGGNTSEAVSNFMFYQNFFSDLGAVDPYSHIPQPITNAFWMMALASAGLSIGLYVLAVTKEKAPRITGILSFLSLLTVGALPSDVFLWPHRIALLSFVLFLTLTFGFLLRKDRSLLTIGIFTVAAAYCVFIIFMPRPDVGDAARLSHIFTQKIVVTSIFAALLAESYRRLHKS